MTETALASVSSVSTSNSHNGDEYVRFPLLDSEGRNWPTYKERFYLTAVSQGHKGHITGTTTKPKEDSSAFSTWEITEAILKNLLASSIPNSIYSQIKARETVKDMYDELGALFESKSLGYESNLRRKLINSSCREGTNLRTHFGELKTIREDLVMLSHKIDDKDFAIMLSTSLPASYESFVGSLHGSTSKISPSQFITRTLEEFDRRALAASKRSGDKAKDLALVVHDKKDDKKRVECFNCKKKGHRKADCWAKGGGKEGEGPKSKKKGKESAKTAMDDKDGVWMAYLEDEENLESNASSVERRFDPFTFALGHSLDYDPLALNHCVDVASRACDASDSTATATESSTPEIQLYDSGASRHMSSYRDNFTNYQVIEPRSIRAADDHTFKAVGMGDMQISIPNTTSPTVVTLKDVLHCPNLGFTLISVSKIAAAGYTVIFKNDDCRVLNKSGKVIGKIGASNGLYCVISNSEKASVAVAQKTMIANLHNRLGHISPAAIKTMIASKACSGLELTNRDDMTPCASCEHAKATRKPIQRTRATPRAKAFGEEVHSDVWGPSPVQAIAKQEFYVSFTDDYTRWTTISLMKRKSETLKFYQAFEAWCATQFGARIKTVRTD